MSTAVPSHSSASVSQPPLSHPHEDASLEGEENGHEKVSAAVTVAVFPPEEDDLGQHLATQSLSAPWKGPSRPRTLPTLHEDRAWDAEYVSFFDLDAEWSDESEVGGSDESFDLEAYGYGEFGEAE